MDIRIDSDRKPQGARQIPVPWGSTFSFAALSISWKVLVTGLVLILGVGYLMGVLNAALSVGLTPGLVGEHYRDQRLSPEEAAVLESSGFVEAPFSLEEEEDDGAEATGEEMDHEQSITFQELAQLAHVHLLGFSWILLATGGLLCLTRLPETLKALVVGVLGVALLGDILGLFLVRFVHESFAWLTVAGGVTIGVCLGITALRVIWELWLTRPPVPTD